MIECDGWETCVPDAVSEVIGEIGGAVFYTAFAFYLLHESDFFVDCDCELSGIGMPSMHQSIP